MKLEDEISPGYIRERRIDLQIDPEAPEPAANRSVVIKVSYSRTEPEGLIPPLVMELQGPSASSYLRKVFRSPPLSLVVTPREGGDFRVVLRELGHNKWWGSVGFSAKGEQLTRGE